MLEYFQVFVLSGLFSLNIMTHMKRLFQAKWIFIRHDLMRGLGQSETGMYCVRFGLVTMETDLEELIAIVYTAGKDVEESSKVLTSHHFSCYFSRNCELID